MRPVDGFSRLMAQTTRTRSRVCLLGVSLILLSIFGVKCTTKTPNFGDANMAFMHSARNETQAQGRTFPLFFLHRPPLAEQSSVMIASVCLSILPAYLQNYTSDLRRTFAHVVCGRGCAISGGVAVRYVNPVYG